MNLPWFKLKGMVFLPKSVIGWAIFLAALAYSVYTFIDIGRASHSMSDALINFMYYLIIILAAYTLIAYFTCAIEEPG